MPQLTERQHDIVKVALTIGRVTVEDLSARFNVTPQTIRKDLNELCELHVLKRTHGGAIISTSVENAPYEARRFFSVDEKRAIGRAAAEQIPNGSSLFINIGTTTECVASALTGHEQLLVITNNLNVAMMLSKHPSIDVIVVGGSVRRVDGAVVGASAVEMIGQFKVDYAVIGASALDDDGALLDFDAQEVQASRAIIANSRKVMLVCDHTKLERSAPVRIGHLSEIDMFVTDWIPSEALRTVCAAHRVEVIETSVIDRRGGPSRQGRPE
eukprot:gene31050-35371_t